MALGPWPSAWLPAALLQRLRELLLAAAAALVSLAASIPVGSAGEAAALRRQLREVGERAAAVEVEHTAQLCRSPRSSPRPVRIFIDGVFDLTHFGHMNAFRQARALGDYLIVGVNSDESVAKSKGLKPVLTDFERQTAVAACRFVDEIVPASPYVMSQAYIQELMETHGIDYFVHGDDPCLVDGQDVYDAAKRLGRFHTIPRTEGISTTDIIGRLLLMTRDHHESIVEGELDAGSGAQRPAHLFASAHSRFLVTSQLLRAFSAALPGQPSRRGRTVYVDGAWDMFHAGHAELLRKARALGDYLLVGVHSDAAVNEHRGSNHPIMSMHERVLSVLGCRHADDVLLNAPWTVTQEMITTLDISVVARGTVHDCAECVAEPHDPHRVPKALGIHAELESEVPLSLEEIMGRLQSRRQEVSARFVEKQRAESDWQLRKRSPGGQ